MLQVFIWLFKRFNYFQTISLNKFSSTKVNYHYKQQNETIKFNTALPIKLLSLIIFINFQQELQILKLHSVLKLSRVQTVLKISLGLRSRKNCRNQRRRPQRQVLVAPTTLITCLIQTTLENKNCLIDAINKQNNDKKFLEN